MKNELNRIGYFEVGGRNEPMELDNKKLRDIKNK